MRRLAAAALCPVVLSAQELPAPPGTTLGPRVVESWSIADGLPVNSINGLLRSRSGYLWAATYDGLVRFDGVRFTVFNSANTPGLPTDRILEIRETRDRALWLITESRSIVRFRNGRFTAIGEDAGLRGQVHAFHEDPAGRRYVGTTEGLFELADERARAVEPDRIRGLVRHVQRLSDGSLIVATARAGIFRFSGARLDRLSAGTDLDDADINGLFEDPLGRLWIAAHLRSEREAGIWALAPGERPAPTPTWTAIGVDFAWVPAARTVVLQSSAGLVRLDPGGRTVPVVTRTHEYTIAAPLQVRGADSVWHAVDRDIYLNDRRVYSLPPSGAAPNARITDLQFDEDGDLWLATAGLGLVRLRRSLFTVVGAPEGLDAVNAYSVAEDGEGALWAGSLSNGITRIAPDRRSVRNFLTPGSVLPPAVPVLPDGPSRLLVGSGQRLFSCALPAFACTREALPDSVREELFALFRRADGTVVLGTEGHVFARTGGRWAPLPGWTLRTRARAFAETPDGALWIGTNGDGIVRCAQGRCRTIGLREGLPSALVRSFHVDEQGFLWIGTEGRGLARLDPRRWPADDVAHRPPIVTIGTGQGLYDPVVHMILDDGLGRYWFNSNRGIYWITKDELQAVAEGRAAQVHAVAYTERDGLRNREGNGGFQPAGLRDRAGLLWFPTQVGVVGIDPRRVARVGAPPPVTVEQITTRTRTLPADSLLELAAEERDLEIDYTALTFREPGNVRFRYRLEPYDDDWVDAGRRRTAFYTRVPPGRYVFRVEASSGGEAWSAAPALATLVVAPFFHETTAARALLLLALLGLGTAAMQWRLRSLKARQTALTALVAERTAALTANERELAAQNAKLAQLNTLRSRLFANLSHEFRTPLTLILGPLRSLLDGRQGPLAAGVREQAELMLRNGQRLLRLINQILDLARLQAGAVAITRQPIELVAYVRGLAQAFLPLAERQGIAIVVRSPVKTLTVAADAEQLEKVLLNLLSNAVKFTPAGGMVDVTVALEDDHAVLVVRDTGIGIAADDLPHVFERFYQAESDATRRYDGTGIGLALAKELVELHGGTISAASVLGEGSTFTVRLPLGATAAAGAAPAAPGGAALEELLRIESAAPASSAAADGPDDDRPTVLLVDDNADIRAYVRGILGGDFQVLEAADGRAGLATAREALPDLIVADVMMPELDGLGLGRALKDDPMTDAIPVILLTARAAADDQIAGFEAGADAYLVKPFDPGVLTAAVGGLLAKRRRLRERLRSGETVTPDAESVTPESAVDRQLRPLVVARLVDPGLNPESLAEAAGLSYHQMYRSLRDELGTTPSRYIRGVRAECAAELLRQGAGSVTEVAYAVGFESLSYFRRAFKERFDRTPSDFLGEHPAP